MRIWNAFLTKYLVIPNSKALPGYDYEIKITQPIEVNIILLILSLLL